VVRRTLPLLAAVSALLLVGAPASAQTTVLTLEVVEEAGARPVADARVQVEGVRAPAWTDRAGRIRMEVPQGRRVVTVRRPGYAAERMTVGFGPTPVDGQVALRVLPVTLAPVQVVAAQQRSNLRARGFYQRVRRENGTFLMRDDIERIRAVETIDIFRRVRGFTVAYLPDGRATIQTNRGDSSFRLACIPVLYVDGVRMLTADGRVDPGELIAPHQIEAIETYAGPASIPPELNTTGSSCGVISIWSRASA
jgi:hypothetical protein